MKNKSLKNGVILFILLAITLSSMFIFADVASSPEFHAETLQALEDKKLTVMELTAATATTSTLVAAIPGDVTSPLANQIIELSEYLLIVVGVIFFEKILLTMTGYVCFTFLIPAACLLFGIDLFAKKGFLKVIAVKLAVFALVAVSIVPLSVKMGKLVEDTYQVSINQTLEDTEQLNAELQGEEENSDEDAGLLGTIQGFFSDVSSDASAMVEKCEHMLSNFIDAVAVLLITSCAIPVLVFAVMLWFVKMIFGIPVPMDRIKRVAKIEVTSE